MILLILLLAGGLLIGFNAGQLSNGLHAVLFVLGLALLSLSTTYLGMSATLWRKRSRNN